MNNARGRTRNSRPFTDGRASGGKPQGHGTRGGLNVECWKIEKGGKGGKGGKKIGVTRMIQTVPLVLRVSVRSRDSPGRFDSTSFPSRVSNYTPRVRCWRGEGVKIANEN